jgi:hypothetical protein
MPCVIPDDDPPTYASLDQPDLMRLAPYATIAVHTTRAADRDELFGRLAAADVVINVRARPVPSPARRSTSIPKSRWRAMPIDNIIAFLQGTPVHVVNPR